MVKKLTVWECEHCKKLFKTPNRHDCKKDPAKKNCFSCKWLNGWNDPETIDYIDVGIGSGIPIVEILPVCENPKNEKENFNAYAELQDMKLDNYNLQCDGYCKGEYYKDVYNDDPMSIF